MENDFYDVASKKLASRGLPHSKTNVLQGLTGYHTENGF